MAKVEVTCYAKRGPDMIYYVKTEGPQDTQAITKVIQEAVEGYLRAQARRLC